MSTRLTANRGLVTSPSELTQPEGSMAVADNIVVDFENIAQQRRGFKEYSNVFDDAAKQIFTYKNRLIAHYETSLAFDSGSGTFTDFTGTFSELIQNFRIKTLETSGNCYFTTSNGVKKISVKSVSDLGTTTILNAGAAKAIDLSGVLVPDAAGFLPAQSKVAYRLVFGYKDASGNLLLGSPSARLVLINQSQDVNNEEIFTVNILDYAAIVDSDYFTFDTLDSGYYVWFKKTAGGVAPINADTIDRTGVMVDIQASGSNNAVAAAIANSVSAAVSDVTVQLTSAEVEITLTGSGDANDAGQGNLLAADVLVTKVFDGSITAGVPAKADLTFTLPPDVDVTYFYQLYRTGTVTTSAGVTLNDIDPGDEQYFIFEYPVSAADVSAGTVTVEDNTPDAFRAVGAYLYTNAITGGGRGIIDANERPPIALDLALFRNSTFYANTKDLHRYTFNILSVDDFVSGTTKFYTGKTGTALEYTFRGVTQVVDSTVVARNLSVGNSYTTINSANNEREYYIWLDKGVINHSFDSTVAVTGNVIALPAHGLATDDRVLLGGTVPGGLTPGNFYYVIRIDANNISLSLTAGGAAIVLTPAVGTATVTHTPVDPALTGKLGIRVPLELYPDTTQGSKDALLDSILAVSDFSAVDYSTSVVRISNTDNGNATAPAVSSPAGWTVAVVTAGDGEDAAIREVLLSESSSVGVAIDLTARSLVRVINQDSDSPVTATYLSGADDLPGKIILESKVLDDAKFYIAISTAALSAEFSPELPVNIVLDSINSTTNVFTTTTVHGFAIGDEIYINDNPAGTPTEFGGNYTIATVPTTSSFTLTGVDVATNQPGPLTGVSYLTTAASDNNVAPNRLYFSKANQPEAVPIVNYIDVGSKDKIILRILALRDNLFVLKEDGIYIVTGASAPNFSVRLLDNSAILIAPDTAVVLNNLIYCLTTQGVVSISDSGVSIVSRNIEDLIKKVTTFNYDFRYTSFGVSYESDRAYLLWLPTTKLDTVATQCFRYSTITNTWTRWTKTNTCGIVNTLGDDRMYLGKGDGRDYIEQERKNGERQDYADRDFVRSIGPSAFSESATEETRVVISSIADVEVGDVMIQEQYATIPKFNRMLKKLDADTGTDTKTYYTDLNISYGVNLGNALIALVTALNLDANLAGTFTVPSGVNTLLGLQEDYNTIVEELNDAGSGTVFKNYKEVEDLLTYEVTITGVEKLLNRITISRSTWFIQGNVTLFKAIKSEVQWSPQHFGKPEMFKQIHEGTLMFDQDTISGGIISYSSDRSADFTDIVFTLDGPGFWACFPWITIPWGGNSNGRSMRTLVPQNKSRCRYLNVKFKHFYAREQYKLIGMSLSPREVSSRAYR